MIRGRTGWLFLAAAMAGALGAAACSATDTTGSSGTTPTGTAGGGGGSGGATSSTTTSGIGGGLGGGPCEDRCADDLRAIVDCHGTVLQACQGALGCDADTLTCIEACAAANNAQRSVGCEYFATFMDQLNPDACFAAFVANIWNAPAHLTVQRDGVDLPVETFAYLPSGAGPSLSYSPLDNAIGLPPSEVAILFLAGADGVPGVGNPVCPVPSAVPSGAMLANQTGRGWSFRITADVPVVVYQINPYGGGSAAITGSSLLLPTSAWGDNYLAINAYDSGPHPTSMNIVAKEDDTLVRIMPSVNIVGGGGLPPGSANGSYNFTLAAGQHAQFTQQAALTGSIIEADKPIGLLGGARCSYVPAGMYACDHLEQMIPPIKALGSEYVGVSHRSRSGEPWLWRLVGIIDDTTLTWSADIGGPSTLDAGQEVELETMHPFVVRSQDAEHPFVLFAHMSGGSANGMNGVGDPEVVLAVPPQQYLSRYAFFADPTYPQTNLVVVRTADSQGHFHDVMLDCAGTLEDWHTLGDYEWTRLDLSNGEFEPVGSCSTGAHEIASNQPFGLWVWGWGSPQTDTVTEYVSYGYPGGMNVQYINPVEIPIPR